MKAEEWPARWCCEHYDLAYDGDGSQSVGAYRTRRGALIAAWWAVRISSWGGSAVLHDSGRVKP